MAGRKRKATKRKVRRKPRRPRRPPEPTGQIERLRDLIVRAEPIAHARQRAIEVVLTDIEQWLRNANIAFERAPRTFYEDGDYYRNNIHFNVGPYAYEVELQEEESRMEMFVGARGGSMAHYEYDDRRDLWYTHDYDYDTNHRLTEQRFFKIIADHLDGMLEEHFEDTGNEPVLDFGDEDDEDEDYEEAV
jgi:hypothetical protein